MQKESIKPDISVKMDKYKELLQLSKDLMKHIEFRNYIYNNINIKNTDEYQELRKYIRKNPIKD